MTITVDRVVVFIRQEHHVDLNKTSSLPPHPDNLAGHLRAGVAVPLLRGEGGDGVLRGGGVARQYLNISIATRLDMTEIYLELSSPPYLYLYPARVEDWFVAVMVHH